MNYGCFKLKSAHAMQWLEVQTKDDDNPLRTMVGDDDENHCNVWAVR